MKAYAVLVAAGRGVRMGNAVNKVLLPVDGIPMVQRAASAFNGLVDGVVLVCSPHDRQVLAALPLDATLVDGGDTRQRSVLNGLLALPDDAELVLVHDAARPFVSPALITRCLECARARGSAVPVMPVVDTIQQVAGDVLTTSLPRDTLRAAQAPQAFRVQDLKRAIERLEAHGQTATDDATAVAMMGVPVYYVEGEPQNRKITTPADLPNQVRIGHGYDAHRLVQERELILCAVTIPFDQGLLGHSDADVALHAVMDALLGAAAMGDIGQHFPPSDPAYAGISSLRLLKTTVHLLSQKGFVPSQVDVTIVCERPKLSPFIPEMRRMLSAALGIPLERTSVKATTTEGMGFEGRGEGISAHAVALLVG